MTSGPGGAGPCTLTLGWMLLRHAADIARSPVPLASHRVWPVGPQLHPVVPESVASAYITDNHHHLTR
jgi:hypothetical protein